MNRLSRIGLVSTLVALLGMSSPAQTQQMKEAPAPAKAEQTRAQQLRTSGSTRINARIAYSICTSIQLAMEQSYSSRI